MKKVQPDRSGRTFFFAALSLIFAAILIPLMFANDERNLKQVQTYLGLPATGLRPILQRLWAPTEPARPVVVVHKGKRLPAPRITLPVYTFSDLRNLPQNFLRSIQANPRDMCDSIKKGGFADMQWTAGSSSTAFWECTSYTPLGVAPAGENAAPSSVFVSIRGGAEDQLSLFRVKINIIDPGDTKRATDLGATAVSIFLDGTRWDNGGDIVDKVRKLEDFDVRAFGSRIRMKREFGEPPRYNFIASHDMKSQPRLQQEAYFDRRRWLELSDRRDITMVDGMIAGNSRGMMLATPAKPSASPPGEPIVKGTVPQTAPRNPVAPPTR